MVTTRNFRITVRLKNNEILIKELLNQPPYVFMNDIVKLFNVFEEDIASTKVEVI